VFDAPAAPGVRHGNRFVTVAEAVGGGVTAGTVGTAAADPIVGDTPGVGTTAPELTPRLPISVDPKGSPVRAAPPGVVGEVDVGVEDAAMLFDPEPHIPDRPEVSTIPEVVNIPDVADIPDDVGIADVAAVAGAVVPSATPPPS
jgi:hypothetical protein